VAIIRRDGGEIVRPLCTRVPQLLQLFAIT